MLKTLAVLRTIFLVFILGYTVRGMPWWWTSLARTNDEQYARCSSSLALIARAAWIAIAWIAFETLVGWWLATRRRNGTAAVSPPPPVSPGPHVGQ